MMLKRLLIAAGIAALIAYPILFWIWASSGFPIDVDACQHYATNGECENYAPEHVYLFLFRKLGEALRDSAFVTALATLVIAAFTGTLWWSTKGTLKLARDEFNATHRPKIRIHAAELMRVPQVKADEADRYDRIAARLICFNVGDSDAIDIEVRGQIFAGSNFGVDVQRPLVQTIARVASGEKFWAEIGSDISIRTAVVGKRVGIDYHCIGRVSYLDQRGLRRESAFLFVANMWTKTGNGERWERVGEREHEYEY